MHKLSPSSHSKHLCGPGAVSRACATSPFLLFPSFQSPLTTCLITCSTNLHHLPSLPSFTFEWFYGFQFIWRRCWCQWKFNHAERDSLHNHTKTFASSIPSLMVGLRSFRIGNSSTKLAFKIQFCSPSFPYFLLSHVFKLYIFLKYQQAFQTDIHP